jgi:uncharacterized protein with HEPN domain
MRPRREFIDYLRDIVDAIDKIERFTAGMSFADFVADDKTSFAVLRALEIIGEAAKKVPDSVRSRYSEVPWREMTGLRDKLIHEYFGVNLEVVWKTLQEDLPPVKPAVGRIVSQVSEEGQSTGQPD